MKRVNSCCTDTIVRLYINYQVNRRKFCCYCLYSTQPEISWPSYKHACTTWTKADIRDYWDISAWIPVYFESVIPLVGLILLLSVWRILYHTYARCVVIGDLICSTPLHQSLHTKPCTCSVWQRAVYCRMQPLSINPLNTELNPICQLYK